jgi:hypothetical protein
MSNKPTSGEQMAVLWYDIPGKGSPVGKLRRFCVALNKSVYVMPLSCVPRAQTVMRPFIGDGADVDITAFVPEETEKLRKRAFVALNKHAKRMLKGLRKSLVKAEAGLVEAERLQSAKDTKKWRQHMSVAFAVAKRNLVAAEECAIVFQITGDMQELLTGIRREILSRHGIYLRRLGVTAELEAVPEAVLEGACDPVDPDVSPVVDASSTTAAMVTASA